MEGVKLSDSKSGMANLLTAPRSKALLFLCCIATSAALVVLSLITSGRGSRWQPVPLSVSAGLDGSSNATADSSGVPNLAAMDMLPAYLPYAPPFCHAANANENSPAAGVAASPQGRQEVSPSVSSPPAASSAGGPGSHETPPAYYQQGLMQQLLAVQPQPMRSAYSSSNSSLFWAITADESKLRLYLQRTRQAVPDPSHWLYVPSSSYAQ